MMKPVPETLRKTDLRKLKKLMRKNYGLQLQEETVSKQIASPNVNSFNSPWSSPVPTINRTKRVGKQAGYNQGINSPFEIAAPSKPRVKQIKKEIPNKKNLEEGFLRDPYFIPDPGETKEEAAQNEAAERIQQLKNNQAVYKLGEDVSMDKMYKLWKQVKNPFAVATAAAKKMGYKDFSEGSPGKEKRGEIAEALKKQTRHDEESDQPIRTGFPYEERRPKVGDTVVDLNKAYTSFKLWKQLKHFEEKKKRWGPPGPSPRPGLIWKPETNRWVRPTSKYFVRNKNTGKWKLRPGVLGKQLSPRVGPPGPPPKPGLVWAPETHRWRTSRSKDDKARKRLAAKYFEGVPWHIPEMIPSSPSPRPGLIWNPVTQKWVKSPYLVARNKGIRRQR